jgi:DNA-binding MarR family transcriptional regulator
VKLSRDYFNRQVIPGRDQFTREVTLRYSEPMESAAGDPAGDALEPRWLSDDEHRAWTALGSVVVRLDAALDAQLRRDSGLSHFEYAVLAALSGAPDLTLRMSELAALAEGSLSRLSQVVARLENRGWVRRSPDPADGRYTLATLTPGGGEKVAAAAPGHVREVRRLVFDSLTRAQVQQLTTIGQRIARAIDPQDRCPTDRAWPRQNP